MRERERGMENTTGSSVVWLPPLPKKTVLLPRKRLANPPPRLPIDLNLVVGKLPKSDNWSTKVGALPFVVKKSLGHTSNRIYLCYGLGTG